MDLEAHSNLVLAVGHSTRSFEEFLGLLPAHGVGPLVDVRRFPHSLRHPHFDGEVLSKWLPCEGGISTDTCRVWGTQAPATRFAKCRLHNPSFRGYADHTAIPKAHADFDRLVGLCEGEERVCGIYSEAVWWRCHRRMTAALLVRGFSVEHVLGEHRRTAHTLPLGGGGGQDGAALSAGSMSTFGGA